LITLIFYLFIYLFIFTRFLDGAQGGILARVIREVFANPEMLDKERIVVISKCDMLDEELKSELKTELDKKFAETPYLFISSVAQQGLTELKDKLWKMLNREDELPENSHNL
jgi:selenocysteine-specific translation elongation factor